MPDTVTATATATPAESTTDATVVVSPSKLSNAALKRQTDARVDIMKKITEHPNFQKIDWTNRRAVIFKSLYFIATMFTMLTISLCYITVFNIHVGTNVTFLIGMILMTLAVVAFAVIGSYVFGAQWDTNALRNSIADLAKNLKP